VVSARGVHSPPSTQHRRVRSWSVCVCGWDAVACAERRAWRYARSQEREHHHHHHHRI